VPVEMHINADTESTGRMLQRMILAGKNLRPVFDVIAETGLASIQQNFEKGGRPHKWKGLADSTKKRKGGRGQVLIGDKTLLSGIHYDIRYRSVSWHTTPLAYAAIHQFGGKAGRGRKVTIPKRPYMLLQDEDIEDINEFLAGHIMGRS